MGMGGNRNEGLAKVGVNSRIVQVGIGHYKQRRAFKNSWDCA